MNKCEEILIEEWQGAEHSEKCLRVFSGSEIEAALREIQTSESAVITFQIDDAMLLVAASMGKYSATAILGDIGIYNMVSSSPGEGAIHFIEGGQSVEMPRRYIATIEQVAAVAERFCELGSVDIESGWEEQS